MNFPDSAPCPVMAEGEPREGDFVPTESVQLSDVWALILEKCSGGLAFNDFF